MNEFEFISLLRARVGDNKTSLAFIDDAACLTPPDGMDLVLSVDAMQEGVHFRNAEQADIVARRCVGAAVSDLLAKGAQPAGCLLTFARAPDWTDAWLDQFSRAFAKALSDFSLELWGGDTTSGSGYLALTVIGYVPHGAMIHRGGAQDGDGVYVTGVIGDGFLGLNGLCDSAQNAYTNPQPPLNFVPYLRAHATSSIDVSDGLAADLDHICRASRLSMEIDCSAIPLSESGLRYARERGIADLLSGGDDYQIAFTAADSMHDELLRLAQQSRTQLTRIGRVFSAAEEFRASFHRPGEGELMLPRRGFTHFLSK